MSSHLPPPPLPDSPFRPEWDVLQALRAEPRVLQLAAETPGNELQVQAQLRRDYSDAVVRGAMSLVALRRKGAVKFSRADQMWFDRQGLEQATSEPVAWHKAQRFSGRVWDVCCGVGGDTLALAQHCDVTAIDLNPNACLRTAWNAEVYECAERLETRAVAAEQWTERDGLVHIDPDRRAQGRGRAVRLEDYVPSLEYLQRLTQEFRGGAIKLSPAANFGGKFPVAEIELISLHGECKEATIWFGELAGEHGWRATALPSGETLVGDPLSVLASYSEPLAYIYDPDPAVVRAGLVDLLAEQLGLSRLDDQEEYLTGSECVSSPFVQTFELVAELSNNPREIRNYFRNSTVGQLEIKARHIPIDVEAIRRKLPLPGTDAGVLLFARVNRKSRALVCRRAVGTF